MDNGNCPNDGAARTVAQVLGEITWLMSQSKAHKSFFISDLEWLVMPPVLLQQFRLYYDTGTPAVPADPGKSGDFGRPAVEAKPIGVVLWARVNAQVATRLTEGASGARMAPGDWTSGRDAWIVEVIAPFGGSDAMAADLKEKLFPAEPLHALVLGADGARKVRVV